MRNVPYYINVNFVCWGRNFWHLEPIKIYNLESNAKLIFFYKILP